MNEDIKKVVNKIGMKDKQDKAIELINTLITDKQQQIIKNPNFKTFNEYLKFNNIQLEDNSQFAGGLDKYEDEFEFNKAMGPGIFNNNYYSNSEKVLLAFFKKYPKYIPIFLAKQNII